MAAEHQDWRVGSMRVTEHEEVPHRLFLVDNGFFDAGNISTFTVWAVGAASG